PDALTPRLFREVEAFEIQPGPAEPGRKARVEQRASCRLAVEKGQDRLELRVRAKAVMQKIGFGRDDRVGRAFEYRELPDEAQHERHILRGREADGDVGRAHRSRHSRAPLPGGPKSRGARPA